MSLDNKGGVALRGLKVVCHRFVLVLGSALLCLLGGLWCTSYYGVSGLLLGVPLCGFVRDLSLIHI